VLAVAASRASAVRGAAPERQLRSLLLRCGSARRAPLRCAAAALEVGAAAQLLRTAPPFGAPQAARTRRV